MDQITKIKNQVRAEQWAKLIQERQNSGQTVVAWCREHDINIKTYYYWLRKLRSLVASQAQTTLSAETKTVKPVAFQKVALSIPATNGHAAVIIKLNGAALEVNEGASQQTIQAVLLALQSVC